MLLSEARVHFVGVGGVGVSALAKVLLEAGHVVSGSDLKQSDFTDKLCQIGARIEIGHRAENVGDADLVVISSAVPRTNPEVVWAEEHGIRVIKRAELLGELTRRYKSVAVAGTHGKTTTSSMVGYLLERAGLDPTLLVGGEISNLGTNAKMGRGQYLVAEADEFDGSFLKLSPWLAVVTNVEADHLDFYANMDAIREAFRRFMGSVNEEGYLFVCADDPETMALIGECKAKVVTYGVDTPADWLATSIVPNNVGGNDFLVTVGGNPLGTFSLRLPGRHNVLDALAAIATGVTVGIDPETISLGLSEFVGARRRFEHKGTVGGIAVFDDYAHHPTEIRATLRAAREQHNGRLWCVFQPHTYNRTKQLWNDFLTAFDDADRLVVCDVYLPAGREVDTLGVSSQKLVQEMHHPGVEYVGDLTAVVNHLCDNVQSGDLVLTMGAGNVCEVADAVLARLRARHGGA